MDFAPVYSASEMRDLEGRAIDQLKIPSIVLMERAGLGAAEEICRRYGRSGEVTVLCGAGNNGGDGFVVARHLHAAGWSVEVFLTGDAARITADARINYEIVRRLDVPVHERVAPARLKRGVRKADVVVDALLGTGFVGKPRPGAAALIEAVDAAASGAVVALDLPSGIDSSTGEVAGVAVKADLTISFHAAKVGHVISPGSGYRGDLVVVPIGVPPQVAQSTALALAGPAVLDAVPLKNAQSTKYSAGAVLVVGGAPGTSGAPAMTALAALRAGGGLVWVAAPPEVAAAVAATRPEIMARPLPEGLELAARAGAVAVGPGLGRAAESFEMVHRLIADLTQPMVIDADGLHALAGQLELLQKRRPGTVLTPHEGEMAVLLGKPPEWVKAHRLEAVCQAAERSGAVVLLKGSDTLVAEPGGRRVGVVAEDVPGLATAGTGDVLTGVVAACLAKGMDPWEATVSAAYMHARAGAGASERLGPMGIIAGDVIDALPSVLASR